MDFVLVLKAIFLGLIESATEFIPVSSTAHLLLISDLINFDAISGHMFEVVIQVGAIMAICCYYRKKIFGILINIKGKSEQKFILNLFLAFLPAAVLGLLLHPFIKMYLFSTSVIAIALIVGGIIMLIVDGNKKIQGKAIITDISDVSPRIALGIGLCQSLAMIAGVSRSGATIIGAMTFGLTRLAAAQFSFFLAIPTISAAGFYDFYKNVHHIDFQQIGLIFVGLVTSFLGSLLVIHWFMKYISSHDFRVFAIYRIVIGILILLFFV